MKAATPIRKHQILLKLVAPSRMPTTRPMITAGVINFIFFWGGVRGGGFVDYVSTTGSGSPI